ncbi:PREDICTED: N-acetyl-D-glucosamine kinase isoform X2 [Eufriesea mexicana]|nr:PREDICTED: N-acetyl-D-glucosamine kinase isoform X2 [Eufriesea mexicana]XP_017752814.1 PREDICTED: N-acetyl-D-glucosamine kinase isoform X2 [Eufriesea mexicana]XP_017752815.1 PREDICTED: N-acetyl-D-glucosamine kinase isoform X2 [Eufriesea mexicana]XP_017752816.1 PREDICTED: N-acetyl-D-glucosamine kinase isoform X2 [Eufriesea mexicana]
MDTEMTQELPEHPEEIRIGGIEGGATHSTFIIMDGKGKVLTQVNGPSTNHWLLGMDETAARINAMVNKGKQAIKMSELVPLDCLCLSLSGCEEEKTNQQLVETIQQKYPNIAKVCDIQSDTMGSLRTALPNGGIVLIAGTGNNALLVNSDGKTITCGGWGHFMGDEGSAFWIAHRACKYVLDDIDDFIQAPKPVNYVWAAMRHYFNVTNTNELLPHFYKDFNKITFAKFTMEIVTGCEKKDPLCLHILAENARHLAKRIIVLSKKTHNDIKLVHGGLKIVCIGSVWKSWDFMKDAFLDKIHESRTLDELTLIRLITSSAIGACYLAAEKINWLFTKPYENNIEIFHHYVRNNYVKPEATKDITEHEKYVLCRN